MQQRQRNLTAPLSDLTLSIRIYGVNTMFLGMAPLQQVEFHGMEHIHSFPVGYVLYVHHTLPISSAPRVAVDSL